jgi:hypothetical protein
MCDHCGCRDFAPIAELTADHEEILQRAWALAEATRAGRVPPAHDVAHLLALLDVHADKEETGLYPWLIEVGGLSQMVDDELEQEHRDLHETLAGGRFDRHDYYALASHIEVEELELFSSAMLRFDEPEWEAVAAAHHAADHRHGVAHRHEALDHHAAAHGHAGPSASAAGAGASALR